MDPVTLLLVALVAGLGFVAQELRSSKRHTQLLDSTLAIVLATQSAARAERERLLKVESDQRLELLTRIQHPGVVLPPPRLIEPEATPEPEPDEFDKVGEILTTPAQVELPPEDADLVA